MGIFDFNLRSYMLASSSQRGMRLSFARTLASNCAPHRAPFSTGSGYSDRLGMSLEEVDPEIFDTIEKEKNRLMRSISLIPSENFCGASVLEALGSVMSCKYSEGYPGARYYGGNQFIDIAENLCRNRALELYKLDPERWGVNVQALSGAPANMYVFGGILEPHDRIMGLDLPDGGHLSHGFQSPSKKVSMTAKFFESMAYQVDKSSGIIDYDGLEDRAVAFRPKIIIAGTSAYTRHIDYARMREICDRVGAYLLADMAHISGLVAPSPFEFADIVTTTTHKSLRGPRGSMIFMRKGVRRVTKKGKEIMYNLEGPINFSVFPGFQGGPHNHTISALAVALKEANTEPFRQYQELVVANSAALAERFASMGYKLATGGTDNHLVLLDLRDQGVDGAKTEYVLELANISCNKNTVPGDKSAFIPGGLRLGSPAMTSRGVDVDGFGTIANLVAEGVEATKELNASINAKKLSEFKAQLTGDESVIASLRAKVEEFAVSFPVVGYKKETMRYPDL